MTQTLARDASTMSNRHGHCCIIRVGSFLNWGILVIADLLLLFFKMSLIIIEHVEISMWLLLTLDDWDRLVAVYVGI